MNATANNTKTTPPRRRNKPKNIGTASESAVVKHLRANADRIRELYPNAKGDLGARLVRHITITDSGCWLWTGRVQGKGYGQIRVGTSRPVVHRVMWQIGHGSVPNDLQLDHLCRVRACCNPAHLDLVTGRENTLRGDTLPAKWAARIACNRGHDFTPENTYKRKGGGRECLTCARERARRHRAATAA